MQVFELTLRGVGEGATVVGSSIGHKFLNRIKVNERENTLAYYGMELIYKII
jgi:hypothetical protein